jgi:hypothetical protein
MLCVCYIIRDKAICFMCVLHEEGKITCVMYTLHDEGQNNICYDYVTWGRTKLKFVMCMAHVQRQQ